MNPNEENQQYNPQQPGVEPPQAQPQPQPNPNWQNQQPAPSQQLFNDQQNPQVQPPIEQAPQPQPPGTAHQAQYPQQGQPVDQQQYQQHQQAYMQQQYPEAYQQLYQQQQADPHYQPVQPGAQVATEQPQAKNNQTKLFIGLAVGFVLLVILGVVLISQLFGSNETDVPAVELTLNEQLIRDSNQLGLGVINFNEGPGTFEVTPEKTAQLRVSYVPQEFNDPRTGDPYVLTTAIPKEGEMQFILGGVCNPDDSISQSANNENFAIRVLLDDGTLHCVERVEIMQLTEPPAPN